MRMTEHALPRQASGMTVSIYCQKPRPRLTVASSTFLSVLLSSVLPHRQMIEGFFVARKKLILPAYQQFTFNSNMYCDEERMKHCKKSALPVTLSILAALTCSCISSFAQTIIPSNINIVNTPQPGTGHDYIKLLSETVSPVNGSLSIRIGAPTSPQRGDVNFPF